MLKITIKLYATFRFNRFKEAVYYFPPKTCCCQVLEELTIPQEEVGTLMVNNHHCSFRQSLFDGDIISIFPVVGGG